MKNETMKMIARGTANAGKRSAANQANVAMLKGGKLIVAKIMGIKASELDDMPGMDKIVKLLMPSFMHFGADQYQHIFKSTGIAPEMIMKGSELAYEKAVEEVIDEVMEVAIPMFTEVAAAGAAAMAATKPAGSAENLAIEPPDERDIIAEIEKVNEKKKTTVPAPSA